MTDIVAVIVLTAVVIVGLAVLFSVLMRLGAGVEIWASRSRTRARLVTAVFNICGLVALCFMILFVYNEASSVVQ